jgi:hypothetical protein
MSTSAWHEGVAGLKATIDTAHEEELDRVQDID